MKSVILELLTIGLLGLALGAGSNAVRKTGSLDPFKDYFDSSAPAAPNDAAGGAGDGQADARFQIITLDEVAGIVSDPDAIASGLYVIVDARNAEVFAEGHIAGAIRCYHYELERCIDRVVEAAAGAEKVIVYCNGGECEDSKYMCHELVDNYGVPAEAVYLFAGGINEWIENDMPFVEGPE